MHLRDYQQQAVDNIRGTFARGTRRVLYVAPTGSGKTVLFAYIARHAAARQRRVCVLVHRRELLLQTCAKLEHAHGCIAPGYHRSQELIQVATVQTLVRRLDQYEFDLLVVDEAHHALAKTYLQVINASPRARVLGVTATPSRLDGKGLGDLFDELLTGPSVQELTDAGYLAPAVVYAPSTIDTSNVRTVAGDWQKSQLSVAADRPTITGCAIEHYRRLADGVPAIAFCVSVAHAQHVAAQFRAAGYTARCVDGNTPQADRDGAIAGLARGTLDVLTSCEIISEGVDVPVVGCGILLRPTKSTALALQQMGRILRPAPGKREAVILDHAGNCLRHGLPEEDREWTLEAGYKQRRGESDGGPSVRQCTRCYFVHRAAPQCPQCGHVYPVQSREVEQQDGELQRLNPEQVRARREVGRARDRAALERIAEARGYNPAWVEHILRARARKREEVAVCQ